MRIVVVSPFSPFPPYWGGGARIFQLIKHLSDRCELSFIYNDLKQIVDAEEGTTSDPLREKGVIITRMKSLGRLSQIFHPFMLIRLLKEINKNRPDFVICEFLWPSIMVGLVCKISNVPMILDEHNVESIRMKRMGRSSGLIARGLSYYELCGIAISSMTLCVSERDLELFEEIGAPLSKFYVLPNGVDGDAFKGKGAEKRSVRDKIGVGFDTPLILFHGKLDYSPNIEAIHNIVNHIEPRVRERVPNARIIIAGSNPPRDILSDEIYHVTGIYQDLPALISAVDLVICPLETGGGTRIKILEALFAGKRVVSTSIGAEGISAQETNGLLLIADEWDDFVDKMVWCLENSFTSTSSHNRLVDDYDWGKNVDKMVCKLEAIKK